MKIAIIGAGISGLGAAYLLNKQHDITLFEKNAYIGGHTRTLTVAGIPVDTGFIVYNEPNYPLLSRLFAHLGVATQKSEMSFGASIADGFLEYSSKAPFAQRKNMLRPQYLRMLADIVRFNKQAHRYIDVPDMTLGECLDKLNMGPWFRQYYLLAMGAAIWSCSAHSMLAFPAGTFLRFFKNHGLLTIADQPQWYTVTGGSQSYVGKLIADFKDKVHVNTAARSVLRAADHVAVTDVTGAQHSFDHVIFASHADETLALLENPTTDERAILGAFAYQANEAVLHSDTRLMPANKSCWASWVYQSQEKISNTPSVSLTYWMNNLQNLPAHTPLFVTLNPGRAIDPALIHDRHMFSHPLFNTAAINAQGQLDRIQGKNRSHFCGAWTRYGFHEDGLMSGVAAARDLGAAWI